MIFFSTCLNIKSSRKQKIIYVCTFSVLALIINMVLPNLYSTFVRMILWPILVILILKTSVLKGILSEVVVLAITSCLEFISTRVVFGIFHVTTNEIMLIPIYRFSIILSIYLVIWLLAIAIKYFKINIKIFDEMPTKTKLLLLANILLMAVVIAMQFYLIYFYIDIMPAFITFIFYDRVHNLLVDDFVF